MTRITIPLPPFAKERPRRSQAGFYYTPPTTVAAERDARAYILKQYSGRPLEVPLGVSLAFHVDLTGQRKKADIDNYVKLILDAGNLLLWKDDGIIHRLVAELFLKSDNPRTIIEVEPLL